MKAKPTLDERASAVKPNSDDVALHNVSEICNDLILAHAMPSGAVHPNRPINNLTSLVDGRDVSALLPVTPQGEAFPSGKTRCLTLNMQQRIRVLGSGALLVGLYR